MTRGAKLIGFLLLLVAIFAGAHVAGAAVGPVSTGHSHVSYLNTAVTNGGMNMGSP
jgi:hypothetical protein